MKNTKTLTTSIILLIVAIIVVFNIVGNTSTNLQGGAESITDANNCSGGVDGTGTTLYYNISDKYCYNSTTGREGLAGQYDLPLNTLFSPSGIVLLVFMASILILMFMLSLKGIKKHK